MFKERYQHMSRQITPDDVLVQKVLDTAHVQEKRKFRTIRRYTRPAAAILAACMGITIAMPALADNVEPVYQAIYQISPSAAQFFMPVHMSDEENGIRMEVESAYVHGNTIEAYITMQDLTGDRIDDTIDLNDSYDINLPFDCMSATCDLVDYNKENKTARFYIQIQGWEGLNEEDFTVSYENGSAGDEGILVTSLSAKDIEGDKITFSLGSFLSHKKTYDNLSIPIDLSKVEAGAQTQEVELNGYSSSDSNFNEAIPTVQALVPTAPRKEFPVEGVEMTGLAYVDGKLHVQIASEPAENVFDGNGYFWLVKNDGTIVDSSESFMYHIGEQKWVETADGRGHYVNSTRYDEYVFDIPQDEIGEYQLSGRFVMTGLSVDGGWRVTFPVENGDK